MPRTTSKPDTGTTPGIAPPENTTPLFNVVLLNDEDHTYAYVIEMLSTIFCVSAEAAFQHAVEVDTTGRTIVITCEREQAEFGREQIHNYGADPRSRESKGSMTAIVEPAGQSR
jgi:ATP-dependent Clp protease adaptor protein ClpS